MEEKKKIEHKNHRQPNISNVHRIFLTVKIETKTKRNETTKKKINVHCFENNKKRNKNVK